MPTSDASTRRAPTWTARLHSIRWQLPFSIAGLLAVVVGMTSWLAYREVRDAAIEGAFRRLGDVAGQFANLMATSVPPRLNETVALAEHAAVRAALTGAGSSTEATRAALDTLLRTNDQIATVALWDSAGRLVAAAHRPGDTAVPALDPPRWVTDSVALGPFLERDGVAWYEIGAPVRADDRVIGHVVQARRLGSPGQSTRLLFDLIGREATFELGTPGGTWTDLVHVVAGPPFAHPDSLGGLIYRNAEGEWRMGAGEPIGSIGWFVWLTFPRRLVLEGAVDFLSWVLPIGFGMVLLGGGAGLVLSRRVTTRLSALTRAASAVAGGDYRGRLDAGRPDELGDVAAAFNAMAARVEQAHHRLEDLVAERTAELRESVEQFRTLAVTAHEAIIIADGQGRISYVNPAAERTFGYAAREAVGEPLEMLMPEQYRERHRQGFARYLATGQSELIGRTLDLEGRRKDGTEFPLELSLATWRGRDGEPAFAGIVRDVTRRREHEAALTRYAAELEAANHELEAFSYSVSHDLRTPLRAMHGFSQALLEDYADRLDAQGRDYLGRVCAGADRMGQLIDDLLELAKASRVEMRRERVDLSELARRVVEDLRGQAPERAVDVRIADDLAAEADPRLMRLVLDNLLGNAWKFTAKNARATIEVGSANGANAFFVRDDGAGFDMAYADKLFGAFQRLHAPSEFSGTGVGLALVQRIIHRHGGRVWAEAAVGRGATFYFTLAAV